MPEKSLILRVCDFVTKYSIYTLIFLVPLFFLPWTTDVLDFNKQALLIVLVFLSLFASMLKILVSGRLEIKRSAMHIVVGVLFIVYLLATVFSVFGRGSFWGQPQQAVGSLITITCFVFLYFLVSNFFSKKDIFISVIALSLSAVIAEFIGIFQLFGLFIVPFDFAKSAAFNTIGSGGSLGLFAAVLLPLAIALFISVKKWWKILFVWQIILSGIILLLVDYRVIWWVIVAGMLTLAFGIIKKKLFDGRWMALPMFFLTVALFFLILSPQIAGITQRVSEVFLSQGTAFNITMKALQERPILGSGPGTFGYDFSKFKDADFSKTSLWGVVFNRPSSEVLNSIATTGVLGFLALLAFMAFPIFYGVKFLFSTNGNVTEPDEEKEDGQIYNVIQLGFLASLVAMTVALFAYSFNIPLFFIYFLTIAALIGLISKDRKEYNLKPSSLLTLIITFSFTLVFIFGIGLLALNGQRYIAEVSYRAGLTNYQANQNGEGLKKLELAAGLNSGSDLYFRQLSQVYILALQDALSSSADTKTEPNDEEKAKFQTLISNAVNAAKIATDINSGDANNWSSRGYIYQSLLGISGDASKWAIESYDSALKLDPNNPYLFAQKGSVYLFDALGSQSSQADQKNQLLAQAKEVLEKAVGLNPSYSNALYSLGITYDALKQKDKAVEVFTTLQQLNPQNTDIPKILETLKSGKSILKSATPPVEAPPGGTVENPPTTDNSTPEENTTK